MKLHFLACIHLDARRDRSKSLLGTAAAFSHQGQLHPQRNRGRRQRGADRRIADGREGPVERYAQIVDFSPVIGQPFRCWSGIQLGFGPLEEIAVIFGMSTRQQFAFAAFG